MPVASRGVCRGRAFGREGTAGGNLEGVPRHGGRVRLEEAALGLGLKLAVDFGLKGRPVSAQAEGLVLTHIPRRVVRSIAGRRFGRGSLAPLGRGAGERGTETPP